MIGGATRFGSVSGPGRVAIIKGKINFPVSYRITWGWLSVGWSSVEYHSDIRPSPCNCELLTEKVCPCSSIEYFINVSGTAPVSLAYSNWSLLVIWLPKMQFKTKCKQALCAHFTLGWRIGRCNHQWWVGSDDEQECQRMPELEHLIEASVHEVFSSYLQKSFSCILGGHRIQVAMLKL